MWKPLKLAPWIIAGSLAWSFGFVYNNYGGGLISWLRAMYENKKVMAAQIEQPHRILIVGGSGAHYTTNSQLLEKSLGLPVFNLALDGNLGLNIIFPVILEQVKPGDIVLLIPEYLMLLDDDGFGERSGPFVIATGKPKTGNIPPKQLAQDFFFSGIPGLRSLVKSSLDLIEKGKIDEYYADPLTQWGEPTKTWERKTKWWPLPVAKPITPHSIERITQFREELKAKGVTLILSLPIIYGKTDPQTMANVAKTAKALEKIAPTVYNQQLNISTDSSSFADTHYHLQPKARKIRSQELVRQIKPILQQLDVQTSQSQKEQ